MSQLTRCAGAVLMGLALCVSGCGGSGGDSVAITGQVTFDGAPVETGTISFMPLDGKGASAGAKIVAGQYETDVPPGEKQVSITGERVVGQERRDPNDPSSEMYDVTESFIPDRYNAKTDLKVSVSDGGGPYDFDLTSK